MIEFMELGIIYAIVTCACFGVVLWKGYYRLAKWFTWFLGISAAQSVVTIFVSNDDTWGNSHVWAPVELLLLLATVGALGEALLLRTSRMNRFPRFTLLFGIVVTSFSAVMFFRAEYGGSDWFGRFLWERVWLLLGIGVAGFCGFWFALLKEHGGHWAIRVHLAIFSLLMVAHVLFSSWTAWTVSNLEYRVVAMVCYIAWAISAVRMDRELEQFGRYVRRYPVVVDPSEIAIPVFHGSLPQGR